MATTINISGTSNDNNLVLSSEGGAIHDSENVSEDLEKKIDSNSENLEKKIDELSLILKNNVNNYNGLQDIIKKGYLNSGCYNGWANGGFKGICEFDASASIPTMFAGIDYEIPMAVAQVIFGDLKIDPVTKQSPHVKWVSTNGNERLLFTNTGEVDMVSRTTTNTQTRDLSIENNLYNTFGPTYFYDGQKIQADKTFWNNDGTVDTFLNALIATKNDAQPATFALTHGGGEGGTQYNNIKNLFLANDPVNGLANFERHVTFCGSGGACYECYTTKINPNNGEPTNCIGWTGDSLVLAVFFPRAEAAGVNPVNFPAQPYSKEPLSNVTADGNRYFQYVLNWTLYALFYAAELGWTSENIDEKIAAHKNAGEVAGFNNNKSMKQLGLEADTFYKLIKSRGNWKEIWNRTLGLVGIPMEGLNRISNEGGLFYSPPFGL